MFNILCGLNIISLLIAEFLENFENKVLNKS